MFKLNSYHRFLFAAILLIYGGLSFYQINLPGLHYDEAFEAIPAVQLLNGQPVALFRNVGLTIGQTAFPLMTQDYIGAINTYAALPFIAALGATPAALRTMSILVGALTLLLTYLLARKLTGNRWVGLAATLLLAVDPTFIFWNRQGVFVTAVTAPIGLAATYGWLRRFEDGSMRWTVIAAFLFGLGIYAKLLFVWLIAALVGAALLLNINRLWLHQKQLISNLSTTELGAGILAFIFGLWPLLVYNMQTGGTFENVSQNAATSYYGVDNLAIGPNLLARIGQFADLLQGSQFWYLGGVVSNSWGLIAFLMIVFWVVFLAMRRQVVERPKLEAPISNLAESPPSIPPKGGEADLFSPRWGELEGGSQLTSETTTVETTTSISLSKIALFPLLVIAFVILSSIATVSALWITHFAILMPWPALAIALGGWYVSSNLASSDARSQHAPVRPHSARSRTSHLKNWIYQNAIWGIIAILVITNLFSTLRYHHLLTISGGLSDHSDAVYDLSAWLDAHAQGQVIAMDWGLAAPVVYLTNGQVAATEIFGYGWQADTHLAERLSSVITQPSTLYLWRAPEEVIFDRSDEFKALYRPLNLEENIEEAFYERSGRPLLGVTRLVEKGTASNPPQ